ncbi:MAG: hypothetical protein ACRDHP_02595, partial [Ktedonobacterales bacterium]
MAASDLTTGEHQSSVNGHERAGEGEPSINLALLKRLSETSGVAGREERVRALVIEELRPLVDELTVDTLGNVIASKRGKAGSRRIMLAAHMDEIGFMVRHIDERGFVRLQPLGGFDARVLVAQRAVIQTRTGEALRGVLTPASKPIHLLADEKPAAAKLDEIYLDLGLPAERVRALVALGDSV